MWFSSWFGKRQRTSPSGRGHEPPRKRPTCRPRLEALEDRWLPSQVGLTVTSLAGSGPGTLRAAILSADAGSQRDSFTIEFAVDGTIDLQTPLPDLNNSIAIQGPGASSLTVERAAGFSFTSAIVTVDAGQRASLSGLTIANGNAGGIHVSFLSTLTVSDSSISGNSTSSGAFRGGGGIFNDGTLTVSGCILSGNSGTDEGGGIYNDPDATLDVRGSAFIGKNTASDSGGALYNLGTATLQGCTLSGNTAGSSGGGIFNGAFGTLLVKDSTVLNNLAPVGADLYNLGALTLDDSTFGVIGP